MNRERFMQLCERAAELSDVCAEVTITLLKCNGEIITLTLKDNNVTMLLAGKEESHQFRKLH